MIFLSEGTTRREKVCFQIQELLLKKSAKFMQIVEMCDADRITVSKCLSELIDEGNVVLKPKRKQGIEKYALTNKGKNTTTLLLEKQRVKKQIDKMTPDKFEEFKKFLVLFMKRKNKSVPISKI